MIPLKIDIKLGLNGAAHALSLILNFLMCNFGGKMAILMLANPMIWN
jgi:hypothetical protein